MFEGSFWELSLIFLLALIVFGPERLPGLARTVGLWMGKARSVMRNFNEQIERELAAEEMRRAAAARGTVESVAAEVKQAASEAVKRDPSA
ncbi:MAG TPA: Sec-independent protein translocase protein TatB [Gammaproteobacteria bacterium]|nr:Sec-independent protein translocase protein TatB [Gammaproteobacteria bacterium]